MSLPRSQGELRINLRPEPRFPDLIMSTGLGPRGALLVASCPGLRLQEDRRRRSRVSRAQRIPPYSTPRDPLRGGAWRPAPRPGQKAGTLPRWLRTSPCSISCRNRRARAGATMSGRVGDLSPKQKEALAKVSPHPGPTPHRPSGASPSKGCEPGRNWEGGERRCGNGGRLGELRLAAPGASRPSPRGLPLPPSPLRGGPGEVWPPHPQPRERPWRCHLGRSGCLEALVGS